MSGTKSKELGVEPMAYFRSRTIAGSNPTLTYPAVPVALSKALTKAGITLDHVDLMEIQEPFGVQALADAKLKGLKSRDFKDKINVNGSGISLGRPIAATGSMRLVTFLHEMKRHGSLYGLETIFGGGGLGIAAILENP